MHSYLYGERRPLPAGEYLDYFDVAHTAFVSVDMHEGHLSRRTGLSVSSSPAQGRSLFNAVDAARMRADVPSGSRSTSRTGLRPSGV